MATATSKSKRFNHREHTEMAPVAKNVDREAGIIRDVKVLGYVSQNRRKYTEAAVRNAIPLYEGADVYIDHRPIGEVGGRPMKERWGRLSNPRVMEDGLYADLHYIKAHPMTEQLLEMAERFPENFGLSHDASGDERSTKEGAEVVSIDAVHSVDVVGSPATNKGLFESKASTMQTTVKAIAESNKSKFSKVLREMMGTDPMMGAMPVEVESDTSPEAQIDTAFKTIVMGILDDSTLDLQAKVDKIKSVLTAQDEAKAAIGGDTSSTSSSEDKMESNEMKALKAEVANLKEESKQEKLKLACTKQLIESKRAVTDLRIKTLSRCEEAERKELIESWPEEKAPPADDAGKKRPASSPGVLSGSDTEYKYPADAKSFRESLR